MLHKTLIYDTTVALGAPKLIDDIGTYLNPLGLFAMCVHNAALSFATLSSEKGCTDVILNAEKRVTLGCHNSTIAAMALSTDGALLATASGKGVVARNRVNRF